MLAAMDLRAFVIGCAAGAAAGVGLARSRRRPGDLPAVALVGAGAPSPTRRTRSGEGHPRDGLDGLDGGDGSDSGRAVGGLAGGGTDTAPGVTPAPVTGLSERRISSHFLNNALAAVASYVTVDPARAETMLADLGTFLRYALDERQAEVTLADELAFVRIYSRIERARFGDGVEVRLTAAPAVREALVPAGVIQEAVQDAFERERRITEEPIRIAVRATERDGALEVQVETHGPRSASTVLRFPVVNGAARA